MLLPTERRQSSFRPLLQRTQRRTDAASQKFCKTSVTARVSGSFTAGIRFTPSLLILHLRGAIVPALKFMMNEQQSVWLHPPLLLCNEAIIRVWLNWGLPSLIPTGGFTTQKTKHAGYRRRRLLPGTPNRYTIVDQSRHNSASQRPRTPTNRSQPAFIPPLISTPGLSPPPGHQPLKTAAAGGSPAFEIQRPVPRQARGISDPGQILKSSPRLPGALNPPAPQVFDYRYGYPTEAEI
ncbi:hypothetical protein KCP77_11870 [Salmonella enterica subsp. enterica]|nr:hypothetical protein KCP77_11870 [Salmonella enterica subsp. enterica]